MRPAIEPAVDRCCQYLLGRAVAPAAAHLEHELDTRDHPSVIHPPGTWLVLRQVRLDGWPSRIRQPEQRHARTPVTHSSNRSGKLLRIKPLIEFGP